MNIWKNFKLPAQNNNLKLTKKKGPRTKATQKAIRNKAILVILNKSSNGQNEEFMK